MLNLQLTISDPQKVAAIMAIINGDSPAAPETKPAKLSKQVAASIASAAEASAATPEVVDIPKVDYVKLREETTKKFANFINANAAVNKPKAKDLLTKFGVEKFGQLPDDKLEDFASQIG